jgi:hypothetical protein
MAVSRKDIEGIIERNEDVTIALHDAINSLGATMNKHHEQQVKLINELRYLVALGFTLVAFWFWWWS